MLRRNKLDSAMVREAAQNVLLFDSDNTAHFARLFCRNAKLEIKSPALSGNYEGSTAMKDGQLDETDRQILRTLSRDGRISNQKLAETVHLSPTPCWHRVKALEEAGFITGYIAMLDQRALGMPDTVIIEVTVDRHDDEIFKAFQDALADLPEVMEAYLLSGEYDYLIKVAVAGTEGYEKFLRQKLYKLPGVTRTRSTFTLRCLKRAPSVSP
jgi:Lrp/AsnC family leucine-responsive transcriptional regulator